MTGFTMENPATTSFKDSASDQWEPVTGLIAEKRFPEAAIDSGSSSVEGKETRGSPTSTALSGSFET